MLKAKIKDKIYNVVDLETYRKQREYIDSALTAVRVDDTLYPIRGKNDNRPGVYDVGVASVFLKPSESDKDYKINSENLIDFTNVSTMQEIIARQDKLNNMERTILTTVDNVYIAPILDNDTAEMRALKKAINKKELDITKYASRFDNNFNNDRRILNTNSITMGKLKYIAEIFDIKATLILEDNTSDVPNPMKERIIVELTGGDQDE